LNGVANVFKALQHIHTKSTMLRKTLFDFSGTAQKDTLVNLAPCAISMCKLMTNPARSTIIGITYFEWEKLVKV
jgi:hypothetical protein